MQFRGSIFFAFSSRIDKFLAEEEKGRTQVLLMPRLHKAENAGSGLSHSGNFVAGSIPDTSKQAVGGSCLE